MTPGTPDGQSLDSQNLEKKLEKAGVVWDSKEGQIIMKLESFNQMAARLHEEKMDYNESYAQFCGFLFALNFDWDTIDKKIDECRTKGRDGYEEFIEWARLLIQGKV